MERMPFLSAFSFHLRSIGSEGLLAEVMIGGCEWCICEESLGVFLIDGILWKVSSKFFQIINSVLWITIKQTQMCLDWLDWLEINATIRTNLWNFCSTQLQLLPLRWPRDVGHKSRMQRMGKDQKLEKHTGLEGLMSWIIWLSVKLIASLHLEKLGELFSKRWIVSFLSFAFFFLGDPAGPFAVSFRECSPL